MRGGVVKKLNPALTLARMDAAKQKSWLALWDKEISTEVREGRPCDSMMGEDIAWRVAPAMDGFYYGYKGRMQLRRRTRGQMANANDEKVHRLQKKKRSL
jgi:hypothetical protein